MSTLQVQKKKFEDYSETKLEKYARIRLNMQEKMVEKESRAVEELRSEIDVINKVGPYPHPTRVDFNI